MRAIADTALRGVVGLVVLAAIFIAIWLARDSSARSGVVPAAASAKSTTLESARTHRVPVTRTSITPEQLRELQEAAAH